MCIRDSINAEYMGLQQQKIQKMAKKVAKRVQKPKRKVAAKPKAVKKVIRKPKIVKTKTMMETIREGTGKRKQRAAAIKATKTMEKIVKNIAQHPKKKAEKSKKKTK
eukprot:TRINITY_DN1320_c0_g1_i7.p3 TRINITY_DN1320_c0_g1~~TRINITY_DN1320_c0_g1_i7.p3  ORF type:complete len:107 (+),score=25.67 TRINITY_DN1320_c0_g1_i7:161-481(+)